MLMRSSPAIVFSTLVLSLGCGTGTGRSMLYHGAGSGGSGTLGTGGSADSGADTGTDAGSIVNGFDSSLPSVKNRVELNFNLDWKYHQGDASGADGIIFDDVAWSYVDLPHSTKFVSPDDPNAYLGISWYRKHFSLSEDYRGSKVFIEFEAAMQKADVWVNGVHKILHTGGYAPFTLDVTLDVSFGGIDNVIAVALDSGPGLLWPPGRTDVDFQYHGGLYRDVNMRITNPLHVTDPVYANKVAGGGVFVTYPAVDTGSATVNVKTNLFNESPVTKSASVLSEIVDAAGQVVGSDSSTSDIAAGTDSDFSQSVTVSNPKLWHPNSPNLYTLRTTVEDGDVAVDGTSTRIGIRRIAWSHTSGLQINGNRFATLGVNMHQEMVGLGNAVPNRSIYYDVKRIKDGGMSFIRASHYPHDTAFYDACDELGVVVLNPQTGWQAYQDGPVFKGNTYQELRDMIRRDRNHPSVVAWEASLNESDYTDAWAQAAHGIVHAEYPGDQAYSAQWKWSRADILIGASQAGIRDSADSRPIIVDEYGDWDFGQANSTSRQAREAGDKAMLIQAGNIEDGTNRNLALSWFGIGSYWDYADYAGFSNYGITRCGIVDMYRLPKFAYYFLQSQRDPNIIIGGVDSGPMVFIANQWTPNSPSTVRVYSNCDQVSLYVNDSLFATQSPDAGTHLAHPPFNFAVGTFVPGTLRADCLIGGVKMASQQRQTPAAATAIRLRPEATSLKADSSDARLVFIDIVDANGTVVPGDSSKVSLSVGGPGSIVGPNLVTMKGGQLAAWLRAGRTPGTITLTANSTGLTSASVDLTSISVPGLPPVPGDRTN
jgi:hypothetical protein